MTNKVNELKQPLLNEKKESDEFLDFLREDQDHIHFKDLFSYETFAEMYKRQRDMMKMIQSQRDVIEALKMRVLQME